MDAVQKRHQAAGGQLLDREQDALARWAAAHRDEALWPLLSSAELRRLRFLAWRRATGHLRPAAPLRRGSEAICHELLPAVPSNRQELWSEF